MPSASTASPATPSTNIASSLCERTIPGWVMLATSSGARAVIGMMSVGGDYTAAPLRRFVRHQPKPTTMAMPANGAR